jgi:type IV secretion system protein VirB10
MRLSRRVLIALGFVAAVAIAGALFFALQPGPQVAGSELYSTDNRTTPDGLSNLPRDYASLPKPVPKLGPPLPGDLGRPILNAGAGNTSAPTPSDPDKQRIAQEQEAARVSRLFATTNVRQTPAIMPNVTGASTAAATPGGGANELTSQDHKLAFLNGNVDRRTVSADRIAAPASPYVLQAGAVIPSALLTGLRSDLPRRSIKSIAPVPLLSQSCAWPMRSQRYSSNSEARCLGTPGEAVAHGTDGTFGIAGATCSCFVIKLAFRDH